MNAERAIRTRLYFTSASHIYSLINLLTLGNNRFLIEKTPEKEAKDALNVQYLGYLSHIEFRLYENLVMKPNDPNRFRL
jgi:inositol hexakisphosphate/diphosphoinositol-pentakisphosphate kinase